MINNTDRELLLLAARASGFPDYRMGEGGHFKIKRHELDGYIGWNPLTDDGDALRLAVQLEIQIDPRNPETRVFGPVGDRVDEYHKPEAFAATRRAIVRAAAAIGEGMGNGS
jgi:hypothetical protein